MIWKRVAAASTDSDFAYRPAHAIEDNQLMERNAFEFASPCTEHDLDTRTPDGEASRGSQASAAVTAPTGEHNDAFTLRSAAE